MEARISLITLGVADLERARRFYARRAQAATASGVRRRSLSSACKGLWLGLYPRAAALAADAHLDPAGSGFGGITLAHNVRTRDEVFSVLAEAMAAGGVSQARGPDRLGRVFGLFRRSRRLPWEVAWNPHFWINEVRLPSSPRRRHRALLNDCRRGGGRRRNAPCRRAGD